MSGFRHEEFQVGGRHKIEVTLPAGEMVFLPGEAGIVEVDVDGQNAEELDIEQRGGRILVRTPNRSGSRWDSFDVTIRTPAGTDLEVNAASADVDVQVDVGTLSASLASGDIRAGIIEGDAAVEAASGDVELGEVGGGLSANTAAGDVRLGRLGGRATVRTASGDVQLGTVLAALSASTQSGDVEVEDYEGGDLECNSTSGDVRIGLPSGRTLDIDLNTLSGDIRSDFSPEGGDGATARLRVKTISGDITLLRATGISAG
ncbi:MAG TPA: DUF4097 family beta strand repeat-containing protein [Rubrobacter sp.]|nr:DUF4097 family beta strand repeat-containing protein [Rubrobacter sp.]